MKKATKQQRLSKDLLDLMEQLDWFFEVRYHDRGIIYEKTDQDGIAAKIEIEDDYKSIRIYFYPVFFTKSLYQQKMILLHEYTHTLVEPLCKQIVNAINGKFVNKETARVALESTTCSVSERLHSLLEGNSRFMVNAYKKIK